MKGINYKKRKLSNVVALFAQHITLIPIITTIAAEKRSEDNFLILGQAINQSILVVGFLVGWGFLAKQLVNKGQPNAAIASAVTLTFFVSLILTVLALISVILFNQDKSVTKNRMKNSAIAGNPLMWPLIGGAFAVDKICSCATGGRENER